MYFRARYYDTNTGEFLSRDPLEYVDGMSLYRGYFVPDSIDPYGLDEEAPRDWQKTGAPYWETVSKKTSFRWVNGGTKFVSRGFCFAETTWIRQAQTTITENLLQDYWRQDSRLTELQDELERLLEKARQHRNQEMEYNELAARFTIIGGVLATQSVVCYALAVTFPVLVPVLCAGYTIAAGVAAAASGSFWLRAIEEGEKAQEASDAAARIQELINNGDFAPEFKSVVLRTRSRKTPWAPTGRTKTRRVLTNPLNCLCKKKPTK